MVDARAQHDYLRRYQTDFAFPLVDDPADSPVRDGERLHLRVSDDVEVRPAPRRIEVSDRSVLPHSVLDVVGGAADAVRVRHVQVRAEGQPHAQGTVYERAHRRGRVLVVYPEEPLDVERPLLSVDVVAAVVRVRLDALQDRQALVERPAGVAERRPRVEVVLRRADDGHRVHRRAATHHTSTYFVERAAVACARRWVEQYVRRLQHDAGDLAPVRDHRRDGLRVRPRLQQQHPPVRVLAQPRGSRTPRRAPADDDCVVGTSCLHCSAPPQAGASTFFRSRLKNSSMTWAPVARRIMSPTIPRRPLMFTSAA